VWVHGCARREAGAFRSRSVQRHRRSSSWGGSGEDLAAEGVRTVNLSGTHYLDPAALRRALEDRAAGK
jgi:hypothetical protein